MAEAAEARPVMPGLTPWVNPGLFDLYVPPEQYFERGRRRWKPEEKLMAAILSSALEELALAIKRGGNQERIRYVTRWVETQGDAVTSFDSVTQTLGVTTHLLRREILRCAETLDLVGVRRLERFCLIGVL